MVNAAQGVSSGEIDIAFIKMRSMFTGMVVNTKYSQLYAPPMVLVWTDILYSNISIILGMSLQQFI